MITKLKLCKEQPEKEKTLWENMKRSVQLKQNELDCSYFQRYISLLSSRVKIVMRRKTSGWMQELKYTELPIDMGFYSEYVVLSS